MFFGAFTINLFDPQILFNDGFYDLARGSHIRRRLDPEAPKKPAALSCRTHMLGRIFDHDGRPARAGCAPEALNAAGFSDSPHFMYSGFNQKGEWYQLFQIGFGGIPGRPAGDGPDGHSLWPAFTNVPNEFLEAYFPLRIVHYETIADSGGAGLHRGGNGLAIGYQFKEPGTVSIHDDRWLTYPWGVNGGTPGGRSTKVLEKADGSKRIVPAKADHVQVEAGDILHFNTWGGGGWGDPFERPPEKVARDVARGLVTAEGAQRYGVVISTGGEVDAAATDALRTQMRANRPPITLFDKGGELEDLRARALAETGLPPPRPPEFARWLKPTRMALAAE